MGNQAAMPEYQCHKRVRAKPMTRAEYLALRGWPLPADENPADAGYLVEYLDGGKANHPDFENYISWSPASVFEAGYKPVPLGFQGRVVAERDDLEEKIERLRAFLGTDRSALLAAREIDRLKDQLRYMEGYSNVLAARIAAFEDLPESV